MKKIILCLVLLLCSAGVFAFDIRGMHVDMRTEVMTIDALKDLAGKLAANGINTILMEWEGTFPFQDNATICNTEAYSKEEVESFISHCERLGIDVIPLQNCFGHAEYILRHQRYASLRESPKDFSQVCPVRIEEAKVIFRSIFKDVLSLHHSRYIHIGCDETRLLGVCDKCAEKISKEGKSKLFCDYVTAMCEVVAEFGKTPVIWADIITRYPEAIESLPKDLIILDWNYGWDVNNFGNFDKITESGLVLWGAPALRSSPDNLHSTNWMKHFNNLRDYVSFCRGKGFKGIMETSWSTSGEYGYIWGHPKEAVDIQPIRQVYPLSGFTILQEAFCKAAQSDEAFDPESFIRDYCERKFGFTAGDVQTMWEYFNLPQTMFTYKNVKGINSELQATRSMQERISSLKPKGNRNEFEHFKMMIDIRANYLEWRKFEAEYESERFNADAREAFASKLKPIMKEAEVLQKRFIRLNSGYLKHPEKAFGEWDYIGSIHHVGAALNCNN